MYMRIYTYTFFQRGCRSKKVAAFLVYGYDRKAFEAVPGVFFFVPMRAHIGCFFGYENIFHVSVVVEFLLESWQNTYLRVILIFRELLYMTLRKILSTYPCN